MSEAKFTEPSWEVMSDQVTGGYLVRPVGWSRGVCTVTQRDPHPVKGQGIDWDQAKANANLIAAAPELYQELCGLLDALAQTPELNLGSWGIYTDSAKSVLSKARGEHQ